ncbi:uncharacterized protein LOC125045797 [Penaeus chinensis]|uniref:uncharacterized protein LOC125045797 n=1 Tax=Penaeus chinensis TaxID=139456 RepID=UPI001FB5F1CA|nr:uncharacterized protein LOC125045797 [Penaeus chinensis]
MEGVLENEWDPLQDCPPVEGPLPDLNEKEVEEAMKKMKRGRAIGCSVIPVDLLKHLGREGIQMVTSLLQNVWDEEKMPAEWEVIEGRLRGLVSVNDMQFGFSPGRGTMDAAFIIKQQQEKHREVNRDLYYTFVDLENAYDRVPRDLVYWCLRQQKAPEKLIRIVQTTYREARTTVRTKYGRTDEFMIGIGLHQGSVLSPFPFIMVLDVISENFHTGLPWELLFADDLVVVADSEEELQRRWLR